jgi:hypothetical protein
MHALQLQEKMGGNTTILLSVIDAIDNDVNDDEST